MTSIEQKIELIRDWLGTGSINFFGRPFAGKDTQAQKLGQYLGGHVIGGGEILRNSNIPTEVINNINRNEFTDEQLAVAKDQYKAIVLPYLSQDIYNDKPLLLSAIGRMQGEEQAVFAAAKESGHPIKAVIYLEISEQQSYKRLLVANRNREDDTPKGLQKRLQQFNDMTLPVINFYDDLGLLIKVDATSDIDTVFETIINTLFERIKIYSQNPLLKE